MSCETQSKLSADQIYERLWQARDTEINSLWQRSVLLGTFLALCYAGYGALFIQDDVARKLAEGYLIHWQAFGVALLGMVFSFLWTHMAKASKAWYEVHEAIIGKFGDRWQKKHCPLTVVGCPCIDLSPFVGFNHYKEETIEKRCPPRDLSIFSSDAGRTSPARINIVIGIFSFSLWFLLAVAHVVCLSPANRELATRLLCGRGNMLIGTGILFLTVVVLWFVILPQIRSSILK